MEEEENKEQPSGNVKVLCRFRPLNQEELKSGDLLNLAISEDNKNLSLISQYEASEPLKFNFDYIFPTDSKQQSVYEIAARPIVEAVMQGFNGTVFAYGQTSSGKTFTMSGPDLENPETMGVIPRMVSTVFESIGNSESFIEYAVKVSYCEIYLEKIRDLLDISKINLKIHEDKFKGVYIDELTERYVSDETDVYELMKFGLGNRNVGSTNMNAVSSRSHSLFLITISQSNNKELSAKTGKLYLVDLAGSEKVGKTGAVGKRLEEAKNINKSLTMLGLVIYSLTDGKSTHIPYRDSKLTRVLQDSLGGNSKTSLIITCSPSPFNEAETISTLRFGMRAKSIKNSPKINKEYTVAELKLMISKCREDMAKKDKRIKYLEDTLTKSGGKVQDLPESPHVDTNVEQTKSEDYEELIEELEETKRKLKEEIEKNSALDSEFLQDTEEIKAVLMQIEEVDAENKVYVQRCLSLEPVVSEKEGIVERLEVTKETLETEKNNLMSRIGALERNIKDKEKMFHDVREPAQRSNSGKHDLLKTERELNSNYQKEIQKLRQNISDLMSKNCPESKLQEIFREELGRKEKDKWNDERRKFVSDLQKNHDRAAELETQIDQAKDTCKSLESYMTDGERALKKKTDILERNLEQLQLMFQQLVNQKSTLGVDGKLAEKKLNRVQDFNKKFEDENKRLKSLIDQVENKAVEEVISSQKSSKVSMNNMNIKKTIKGGNPNRSSIVPNS